MRAATVLVVACATGCAYKAGSFSHPRAEFAGQKVSVGCLDLAVERRPDLPTGGTVLAYSFGNRCDRPATIDLSIARVEGRTFTGASVQLAPYDPEGEIHAMPLDGRAAGAEAVAYPSNDRLAEVCVDAASIAQTSESRWLCFASNVPPPTTLAEVSR